jgi:hypothetical protein
MPWEVNGARNQRFDMAWWAGWKFGVIIGGKVKKSQASQAP